MSDAHLFTLGIEEEYLLVDRTTGAVAAEPPDELFAALHERTAGRAFPEFLRAQVEVKTAAVEAVRSEFRKTSTKTRAGRRRRTAWEPR